MKKPFMDIGAREQTQLRSAWLGNIPLGKRGRFEIDSQKTKKIAADPNGCAAIMC